MPASGGSFSNHRFSPGHCRRGAPRRRRPGFEGFRGAIVPRNELNAGEVGRLTEERLKRLTKRQLVGLARREALPNRSKMNKAQLARTLRRHFQAAR